MKRAAVHIAIIVSAVLIAPIVHAQDSAWYAGFGLGYSRIKFYPADFASNDPLISDDTKNFDAGYKFTVGYKLARTWAIEGAYVQPGKFQYFYNDAGIGGSESLDYKVTGFALSVLPSIPFGNTFSIYGRVGAFFSNSRLSVASASGPFSSNLGFSTWSSYTSLLTGLGFQFDYDKDQSVRLEYENYGRVGSACSSLSPCTGRAIVQMVSANLIFKF